MLRDSKAKPRQIKLDKQPCTPTFKMLDDMRQRALSSSGTTVELPFGDDTQTLILTVSREMAQGTWVWMLYRDDGFSSGLEWSHATHDVNFIHTLVTNSSPGFMTTRQPASKSESNYTTQEQTVKIRKGSLEGNLKNIQVANLLQSVSMGQMTGRLEIVAANDTANIFFSAGKPVHAALRGAEGNEALIQMFGWDEGEFSFYDEPVNVAPTVTRGLTGLMMEGAAFVDHLTYLNKAGLSFESYPIRVREFSPEEFAEALKKGVDCDLSLQQNIFNRFTGTNNWASIVRDFSVRKTEWVPAVFNLASCGLIRFDKQPAGSVVQPVRSRIDWSVVQQIENGMRRADTGIHTHAALLYSLQQEFYRFQGFEIPFSLIVFGYCYKQNNLANNLAENAGPVFIPFKARAIQELRERIYGTKQKWDILAHYGAFAFAVLLPLTIKDNAKRASEILAEACAGITISDEYSQSSIELCAGVANVPEDCNSLEDLMAIAERVHPLSG